MVTYKTYGSIFKGLDFSVAQERCQAISDMIDNKTGEGNDFLGWVDLPVEYDKEVTIAPITDRIEIDVSGKRLIFK